MVESVDWPVEEKFARQHDFLAVHKSKDEADGARELVEKRTGLDRKLGGGNRR